MESRPVLRSVIAVAMVLFQLSASLAAAADAPAAPRQRITINAFWKYHQGDAVGAEVPAYDDAAWQSFGLPHSFSIPYFMSPDFYTGYGWYRKHLQLPDDIAGKHLSLEFDGVFQEADVFVNGTKVGSHKGGYTGFSLNITAAAKPGDNLIAVRVNNLWNPRLAPRSGEHVFSGGIYRDVHFVMTDPLHVDWCGTFVTTPQVSAESALVNVKTDIVNDSGATKTGLVRQQILDPEGKVVAEFSATQAVAAGAKATVDLTSPALKSPRLWHPDHPFLYTLNTTVLDGNRVADQYTTKFGIRSMKWTADQAFFSTASISTCAAPTSTRITPAGATG